MLHVGTTETNVEENVPEGCDETAVEDTYRQFIQTVTGLGSDIVALENHEVLAERLASGKLQLGVFMGYEFAWAQARHPKLKVLALSVNQHSYQYPTLVVHRDVSAGNLADLKGKTLALPRRGQGYGRLFVAARCRLGGMDSGAFLGHVDSLEDVETLLDDVVDGKRAAAVVDRLGLEMYRRRKPGRFARLKKLCESPPMPPALVAYYEGKLDPQIVTRLRADLAKASQERQGELLLLFRQTSFAPPSPDFERVLTDTRKTYPAPALRRRTQVNVAVDSENRTDFRARPIVIAAANGADKEPRQGSPEYYLCVFAFETVRRRATGSHTFATFIKSSAGSVEAHTISWFPRSKQVHVNRTRGEPGQNFDLKQTLGIARGLAARVYEWGPYRIRPEFYERGLRQIERLNSGRIQFKALDGAWRPDTASNCMHAVSDVDAGDCLLTVDGAYGVPASARIVEYLSRWMIQPGRVHPSIDEKLGLSGQPIIHVAYKGERTETMTK
jgi:ABC-type phosphate/phosphonate transport system substrate-binding protein